MFLLKTTDEILADLIEALLEDESQRQGIPLDATVVAENLLPEVKELVQQSAYETVAFLGDARESLPSWESPTGDVPSMAELKGQCR